MPFSGASSSLQKLTEGQVAPLRGSDSGFAGMITFPLPLDAAHTLQVLWEQHVLLLLAGLGVLTALESLL